MKEEQLEKGLGDIITTPDEGYQVIWNRFKGNTTAHGVPHITNATGTLKKSFWILITLGTLALLVLTLYSSFTKYFSYPVEVRLKITTAATLNFPAITVCNMNPIKSSLLSTVTSLQNVVSGKRRRKRDVVDLEDLPKESLHHNEKAKHNRRRRSTCSIPLFNDTTMSWCYEFYDSNNYTLNDATVICPQSGSGRIMVVLDSVEKINHARDNFGTVDSYWLNANQSGGSNARKWNWGDGSGEVATGNWNADDATGNGKPATTGPCLYVDGQDDHKFVPSDCDQTHRLMCQTPMGSIQSTSITSSAPGTQSSAMTTEPTTVTDTATATAEPALTADEMPLTAEYVQAELFTEKLADLPTAQKSALGYQQSELLIECQYNGRLCVQSDITFYFNPILGNCYTYNYHDQRKASKTGRRYGLSLVLNVAQDEYVRTSGDVAGVRLIPHHPDTMPFPEDEGLILQPGLLTSIGLRQTNITRQGGKYSDCIPDAFKDYTKDLFMETYNKSYGQSSCSKTCYQKALTASCGCADPSYPMSGQALGGQSYHACSTANSTQVSCRGVVISLFNNNSLKCDCPSPCRQVWYSSQTSHGQWPNDVQKNTTLESMRARIPGILDVPGDPEKYKRNLIKTEVYFEELNMEEISEIPSYTDAQFVSDIGGLLGLFIGFSVMTIFEFLELLVEVMVFCISSSCFRSHTTKSTITKVAPNEPSVEKTTKAGCTDKMQIKSNINGGFSLSQGFAKTTTVA